MLRDIEAFSPAFPLLKEGLEVLEDFEDVFLEAVIQLKGRIRKI